MKALKQARYEIYATADINDANMYSKLTYDPVNSRIYLHSMNNLVPDESATIVDVSFIIALIKNYLSLI